MLLSNAIKMTGLLVVVNVIIMASLVIVVNVVKMTVVGGVVIVLI